MTTDTAPGPVGWRSGWALGALGVAGAALLYEVAVRALFEPRHVPPLSACLPAAVELLGTGAFWSATGATLGAAGLGTALALLAGIALGFGIGSVPWLLRLTSSTLDFLRPVPPIVLIPVLVFLLDVGQITVLLVAVSGFWIVLFQVLYGLRDVDPVAVDTARCLRLGPLARARHVTWPTVLPYLATALRLVVSVALALAVTGGLVMGAAGLGELIWRSQEAGEVTRMYGLVLLTGCLGVALDLLARAAERRLLHWHLATRRAALT
ncbi:ABC transporter permease subunit [Streptomyces sp. DSM 44915]|uniref:ABC transporter permease subunit n=1 Tax=Streptomyces chisholmiae TaxID=3075540 RepID=A0ABU2JR52_9ACTN|nr:ABC transporter permease subunit [Streptomyces sp. DSM 44915]MDT0266708.1 ABC transporter permease subunit [Streptomyces sp. DSM 44915]